MTSKSLLLGSSNKSRESDDSCWPASKNLCHICSDWRTIPNNDICVFLHKGNVETEPWFFNCCDPFIPKWCHRAWPFVKTRSTSTPTQQKASLTTISLVLEKCKGSISWIIDPTVPLWRKTQISLLGMVLQSEQNVTQIFQLLWSIHTKVMS